jgi:hypothetical protein
MCPSRSAFVPRTGRRQPFPRCAPLLRVAVGTLSLIVFAHTVSAPILANDPTTSWLISMGLQPQTPHPAVVRITAAERNSLAQGSGCLVAVSEQHGLVLTNWHVVRDAAGPIAVVFPDGFRTAAQVLKVDEQWDLAALLIWKPRVSPLALSAIPPRPGDVLTIAGYGSRDYRSASGRCTQYVAPGPNLPYEMVEVSVAARQGDSGGPILNQRGELAGVLFGSSGGTTSGSYCGRVRGFLAPLWPSVTHPGSTHAIATTTAPAPLDLPTPPAADDVATADAPPVASAGPALDPSDVPVISADYGPPRSGDHAIGVSPGLSAPTNSPDLRQFIGYTPWEQIKAVLAGIGSIVVLARCMQWLSSGETNTNAGPKK